MVQPSSYLFTRSNPPHSKMWPVLLNQFVLICFSFCFLIPDTNWNILSVINPLFHLHSLSSPSPLPYFLPLLFLILNMVLFQQSLGMQLLFLITVVIRKQDFIANKSSAVLFPNFKVSHIGNLWTLWQ